MSIRYSLDSVSALCSTLCMSKQIPSYNCQQRVILGLPLAGAFIEGRLAEAYTILADIGCAVERLTTPEESVHLAKELRQFGEALDVLQFDALAKGDAL